MKKRMFALVMSICFVVGITGCGSAEYDSEDMKSLSADSRTVQVNGTKLELPCLAQDVLDAVDETACFGTMLYNTNDEEVYIEPGEEESCAVRIDGENTGLAVELYNQNDSKALLQDCYVISIEMAKKFFGSNEYEVDVVFPGGIEAGVWLSKKEKEKLNSEYKENGDLVYSLSQGDVTKERVTRRRYGGRKRRYKKIGTSITLEVGPQFYKSEKKIDAGNIAEAGIEAATVIVNEKAVELPIKVQELCNILGSAYTPEADLSEMIDAVDGFKIFTFKKSSGDYIEVYAKNESEEEIALKDCLIHRIGVESGSSTNIVFPHGLQAGQEYTKEQLIELLGEPDIDVGKKCTWTKIKTGVAGIHLEIELEDNTISELKLSYLLLYD